MTPCSAEISEWLEASTVRVVFGPHELDNVGSLAAAEGFRSVLLVTDPGVGAAGHVARAVDSLERAALSVLVFDGAGRNPTTEHVEAGLAFLEGRPVDSIVGLGGGSAMDCAKGINLLLTNGGAIADYWGVDKAAKPMLPMIAVPTTAGTGSEAQSFALIADAVTGRKMACGVRRPPGEGGLRPCVAILDPELTRSQPRDVAASAGMDAVAHAVETAASNARTPQSRALSRSAWRLLDSSYETAVTRSADDDARSAMLLGAHLAGAAIEQSMLGAAHACANPLTARFDVSHGDAVGLMLPHVVRFNAARCENPYSDLSDSAEALAVRIEDLLIAGGRPTRLVELGVPEDSVGELAEAAADEWTASYNPVAVGALELSAIYHAAYLR